MSVPVSFTANTPPRVLVINPPKAFTSQPLESKRALCLQVSAGISFALGITLITQSIQFLGHEGYSLRTTDSMAMGGFLSLYASLVLMTFAAYHAKARPATPSHLPV